MNIINVKFSDLVAFIPHKCNLLRICAAMTFCGMLWLLFSEGLFVVQES